LAEVKQAVAQQGWQIELEAAAEYYLDEYFIEKLKKEEPLLTFGDRYLLFETSFINQPVNLHEAVFLMQSLHYRPVLAHPERYMYLQDNFAKCTELFQNGVLLQININSLSGYYSVPAQLLAERLIDLKMVHFAGTDCHAIKHIKALQMAKSKKYYSKLLDAGLLNHKI
jgi:tyrosine-protein phosphatase YwqE